MKKIILVMAFLLALALINNVSAIDGYCFLNLHDGESTSEGLYACHHTLCQVCSVAATRAYATWNKCDAVCEQDPGSQPNLTLTTNWPFADGGIFTKQNFFLDISTNLIASITLNDNVAGTQKNLCPNCKSYKKSATFRQGFNDITIRAVKGSEILERRITFFIDSKKPRISKTLPASNKYASSMFTVFYTEDNVKEIKLKYGNSVTGMREALLLECASGKNVDCSIDRDLIEFDNQQISYWFEITDIANNIVVSRSTKIKVDETAPVINDIDYTVIRNYITLIVNITEKNPDKVYYTDNNWDGREKILCSSLSKGICKKKISFKGASPNLVIRAVDKAGNEDTAEVIG